MNYLLPVDGRSSPTPFSKQAKPPCWSCANGLVSSERPKLIKASLRRCFVLRQALDSHPASNFVVLLAHTKLLSFKGLYACSGEEDGTADRVFGLGPPQVDASMVSAATIGDTLNSKTKRRKTACSLKVVIPLASRNWRWHRLEAERK